MTPYLSDDWFRLWKVALDEAERLDMNVWIYDENSYPSGFAGGWVPELMPESRGRGLAFREVKPPPKRSDDLWASTASTATPSENVTAKAKAGEALPEGALPRRRRSARGRLALARRPLLREPALARRDREVPRSHPGGLPPRDRRPVRQAGARRLHRRAEHPPRRRLALERDPGPGVPEALGLRPPRPSAQPDRPVGDWRKVRHNYFQVLNEQFIEHWSKPYHDYCETNHLEWTGHYWDHEWPNCVGVPDNMAMYAWHQRPAIDCLMNQYAEDTHAQFGNVRMAQELSSVANQLGMKRTLCEVYGAGGWDLRFEDMKRIGDWLEVLGVNTLDQHLSYVTIRGARKRDHPQSFSYHEPWWDAYHVSAQYFARLSAALSQGEQINPVLVLEPTTTAWMYQGDEAQAQAARRFVLQACSWPWRPPRSSMTSAMRMSSRATARSTGGHLRIGNRTYRQVVLPPVIENLNSQTKAYLDQVGWVATGPLPARRGRRSPHKHRRLV